MTDDVDLKVKIAARAAELFLRQLAGVPADVQLMAVQMIAQTIFLSDVPKTKRLQLLTRWTQSIRTTIIEKEKQDVQKSN